MTTILGFAAKAGGGKTTAINFILGTSMVSLGIVKGAFKITSKGELWLSDIFGDPQHEGVFDYTRQTESMKKFKADFLDQYIKVYSFADTLKEFVINVLGVPYENVYGSYEQKVNVKHEHIRWENMPGVITEQQLGYLNLSIKVDGLEKVTQMVNQLGLVYHESGPMSAREVLQHFGTDICRRMYGDCWVLATRNKIKKEQPEIALVGDVRFRNEVEGLQEDGGFVTKFTRAMNAGDSHKSEIELDNYDKINFVLDNKNMSITEQNEAVYSLLANLGLVDVKVPNA